MKMMLISFFTLHLLYYFLLLLTVKNFFFIAFRVFFPINHYLLINFHWLENKLLFLLLLFLRCIIQIRNIRIRFYKLMEFILTWIVPIWMSGRIALVQLRLILIVLIVEIIVILLGMVRFHFLLRYIFLWGQKIWRNLWKIIYIYGFTIAIWRF